MTYEDIKNRNFFYVPRAIKDKLPPLMQFVPCIDSAGEIIIYRRTEYGWNMRDIHGDNTPNNNLEIVSWLEKMPLFEEDEQDILLKILDHNQDIELNVEIDRSVDFINKPLNHEQTP